MPDIPNPALNRAQAMIAECDAKLERYRAALEAGADPSVVTAWIAQAQADRARAHADAARYAAGSRSDTRRMSREEITALVNEIADAIAVLREADPDDKAELYRQLGVRLTYHPETQTVSVQAHVGRSPWGNGLCPRGDLNPHALYGH
jgi:site-specific DNA recombinase